jgi:hypothetical protein
MIVGSRCLTRPGKFAEDLQACAAGRLPAMDGSAVALRPGGTADLRRFQGDKGTARRLGARCAIITPRRVTLAPWTSPSSTARCTPRAPPQIC